jgi:predicted phosphoribosyltransferase
MGTLFEDRTLRDKYYVFPDRYEAGRLLSDMLRRYKHTDAIILAIPAGGVPVAREISRGLHLPLDLVIVRKIQIPGNTEAGFGAMGPDGEIVLNQNLLGQLRLSDAEIQAQIARTRNVVEQRNSLFRQGRPFPRLRDRTAILVDDGLASGYTMSEAIGFIRKKSPEKIIVAVPTAPERTINFILPSVDELYCLNIRSHYPFAVANAYKKWHDLSDAEVLALLENG